MLFDLKIYSLKIADAGLILYPLKIEMLTIPLCGRNAIIFVHKFRIHIVRVSTCQNVGSEVVWCVSFPLASLVAGDFFVNVCSHCFVYLLFSVAKLSIIFITPNIFLLFYRKLCFCSLKIAGCVPKIPIWRKKIKIPASLKISVRSKNPYLKISVQWCSGAICPEFCKGIQGLRRGCGTHGHDTAKGEQQRNFFAYI